MQTLISDRGNLVDKSSISETTLIRNGAFCGDDSPWPVLAWFGFKRRASKTVQPRGGARAIVLSLPILRQRLQTGSREIRRAA